VKSNIGHTQAAAGAAGVIKMVLALQHGVLPATLHAGEPSPHVDWDAGAVRLLTGPVYWPAGGRPRRAGVSAFGISGTNAHVILAEAPAAPGRGQAETGGTAGRAAGPGVLPVTASGVAAWVASARTEVALAAQAGRLAEWVAARPGLDTADVGWSLAATRSEFEHRAVVLGTSRAELTAGLGAVVAGEPAAGVVTGLARAGTPRVVFVFPGQGGQWAGMGRELAASSPVFAARLAECGQALARYVDWDLGEVIAGAAGAPGLEAADVVQPALWAMMVSLAAVWQAAGVRPDAVAGHSQGEIAAACVAGILSLEDAAQVVALRSQVLGARAGQGGMVSVAEPAAVVRDQIAPWGDRLSVAAVNGPEATVVSGESTAVDEFIADCVAREVRARRLPVDYASHSAQVEAIKPELLALLDGISPGAARIPMVSAMSGAWLAGPDAGAGYWYASLRAPVEFDRAVRVLAAAGHQMFIEVSPRPVLTAGITATLEDAAGTEGDNPAAAPLVTGTLRRHDGGAARFLASLAETWAGGAAVDWTAVLGPAARVDLPTYAFRRQRFWARPPAAAGVRSAGLGVVGHPLLGAAVELAPAAELVLTGLVSARTAPWLADHVVAGAVLVPGTALVELAVRAGDAAGCGQLEELVLEAPLVVPADGEVQLQVVAAGPGQDGRRAVEVYARGADANPQQPWTRHASGSLAAAGPAPAADEFTVWPPPGAIPVDVGGLYPGLAAAGYGYGPSFRGLRAAWQREQDIFVEVVLPEDAAADAAGFGLHPALLDAALHVTGLAGVSAAPGEIMLPFAWNGVSLHAAGAPMLRARLRPQPAGGWSLTAADGTGAPVVTVESLALRPVQPGALETAQAGPRDALFGVDWVPVHSGDPAAGDPAAGPWAVTGRDQLGLVPSLAGAGEAAHAYPDLAALAAAIEAGTPAPRVVLACAGGPGEPGRAVGARAGTSADTGAGQLARAAAGQALGLVQAWLAEPRLEAARLIVVTRGAMPAWPGEGVADLAGAAVWGLVRSVQSENPGRLALADLPAAAAADGSDVRALLAAVLDGEEPELAVRDAAVYGRRLVRPSGGLVPPGGGTPWRLDVTERGTLGGLALVGCQQAAGPLAAGQVRVAVRAAGLNFRDVLIGLDMYPGTAVMGGEIAGVVTGTGPGVTGLAAGDRVLGLAEGGFGPVAVTDARLLAPIPAGWSFAQAAAVPVAFTTAWYALADLAGARSGQRLLVHAAAGGVGMAAVSIARHLGLEVYGTANPGKHGVLAALGLDAVRRASSRTAGFEQAFLAATAGAGMDIVLNALAGELTDASLRLLPRGGAFIEMGKTDVRDPAAVGRQHPGVSYRAFETGEAGPDRLGQILGQVVDLLAAGRLALPPVRAWDVRRAPEAFRFMSQARHTGKIVLTIPPDPAAPRPAGTVLVTGGTGMLGGLVARHLAAAGRAARVVLASRSGPAAPGAAALAAQLAAAGSGAEVIACDTAQRAQLAGLLAGIPAAWPLTGVVHAAGVIDDGVAGSLTPARVDAVMRPKADAAWHLHQLTQDADLEEFVLFSSAAATAGSAGQGNYAAANAFLDALAAARRAAGLPALSLAWGLWSDASAMTGHLGTADRARVARSGMTALAAGEGLALLDAAAGRDEALLVPARLDVTGLRARAARGAGIPPLWRALVPPPGGPARPGAAGHEAVDGLRHQLAGLPGPDRDKLLLDLVRAHVAAVIGHASAEAVEPDRSFRDLGFDSLTAVELRNRLNAATGIRLPATLVFDYPTPAALSAYLQTETSDLQAQYPAVMKELDRLESTLSAMANNDSEKARIITRLEALMQDLRAGTTDNMSAYHDIDAATDDEMFDIIDEELGI
jgi:acyl transferase domain-containing protein/acyl carrier protein